MHAEDPQQQECVSCGSVLYGKYCSKCGEKVLRDDDRRISHFFEELFHDITHADGKFLKSLKYLITKPGFLTKEYIAGRRKLYSAPLSLFFIANVIYLLFGKVDALNSKYVTQMGGQPYSASIRKVAEKKMVQKKWTEAQMEERYDAESGEISKELLIVLVILFSIPVSIIFYSRRQFYLNHVILATEFMSFIIYVPLIILPYVFWGILLASYYLFKAEPNIDINSLYANILLFLILFIYLAMATRRVYKQAWAYTIPKTLILVFSLAAVVIIYRYLLFYFTMLLL